MPKTKKTIKEIYLEDGYVYSIISDLKKDCKNKQFSDLIDANGNQYVDLVLEGGGTLGFALLGYLFVLEELNIRFARTAGTSAGSIVALLLATTPINEKKVGDLLKIIHDKSFNDFVDLYGSKADIFEVLKITNDNQTLVKLLSKQKSKTTDNGYIISNFIRKIETGVYNGYKFLKLFDNIILALLNKGLAKGDKFLEWLSKILIDRDIRTLKDLIEIRRIRPEGLQIRPERIKEGNIPRRFNENEFTKNWNPELAIVAAEIKTETKVEFPKHAELFWPSINRVNPAVFVRASMSIPLFYSPFKVALDNPTTEIKEKWQN